MKTNGQPVDGKEPRWWRWNCFNQSFILFHQYAVQWLGSEWQADKTFSSPPAPPLPRLRSHHSPNTSIFTMWLVHLFFPSYLGENICTWGPTSWCNSVLLHQHHLHCSSRRSPRWSFISSRFQMARMPLSFVGRKPVFVSHSTLDETQTEKQCDKGFCKLVSGIWTPT